MQIYWIKEYWKFAKDTIQLNSCYLFGLFFDRPFFCTPSQRLSKIMPFFDTFLRAKCLNKSWQKTIWSTVKNNWPIKHDFTQMNSYQQLTVSTVVHLSLLHRLIKRYHNTQTDLVTKLLACDDTKNLLYENPIEKKMLPLSSTVNHYKKNHTWWSDFLYQFLVSLNRKQNELPLWSTQHFWTYLLLNKLLTNHKTLINQLINN